MPLRTFLNWLSLDGIPEPENGWLPVIRQAGYDGIQLIEPLDGSLCAAAREAGLRICGSGRVNTCGEADRLAAEAAAHGLECLTLHVGWGMEDDDEALALLEAVLAASARHALPMYVETHRATLFQDIWRSVGFVKRLPELRFNGDFSHWYTGQEFVYGGFERKLDFIRPVIERVDFMHGRIGNPGSMQVDIGPLAEALTKPYVRHFEMLWRAVFAAFLQRRGPEADFLFAPELLGPAIYYAREFAGHEESDRWAQSLVLVEIAQAAYDAERARAAQTVG